MSDNGASQEGGETGVLHEWKYFNFVAESPDDAVAHLDDIGGPNSHTNYPWGWAQAGNAPFKWYKQNTHEGGVHVPLIVHWPDSLPAAERGALRDQFHHVNDIAPTIYDVLGVTPPQEYRGHAQMPVTGISMRYTLAGATEPSRKEVQYFEMMGHRGIYRDGWKAVTRHTTGVPYDDDEWELYHVEVDRSECVNLAKAEPDRLADLVELWWTQAREHNVLPLDDRTIELFGGRERAVAEQLSKGLAGLAAASAAKDGPHQPSKHYTYRPPMTPIPPQAAARINARSWDFDAVIDRQAGDGGVLYATGNQSSGLSIFIQDERLVFDYNFFGAHYVAESQIPVPAGRSIVGVRFRGFAASPGHALLVIDGAECGRVDVPFVMLILSSIGASVGFDHGSAVSPRYQSPFRFAGTIDRIDFQVVGTPRPGEIMEQVAAAESRETMSRQ
jgi:hypothetical protein